MKTRRSAPGIALMGVAVLAVVGVCVARAGGTAQAMWAAIAAATFFALLGAGLWARPSYRASSLMLTGSALAGSFLLMATGILGGEIGADDDSPAIVPHGWAIVGGPLADGESRPGRPGVENVRALASQVVPGARVAAIGWLYPPPVKTPTPQPISIGIKPGCTPFQASRHLHGCQGPLNVAEAIVTTPDTAASLFGASPDSVAALERGEFVVPETLPGSPTEVMVVQGKVIDTIVTETHGRRKTTRTRVDWVRGEDGRATVPVTVDTGLHDLFGDPGLTYAGGMTTSLISPAGVARFGGHITWRNVLIAPPVGEVTHDQQRRLDAELARIGVRPSIVERRAARPPWPWMTAGIVGLCVVLTGIAHRFGRRRSADPDGGSGWAGLTAAGLALLGLGIGSICATAGFAGSWGLPYARADTVTGAFLPWISGILLIPAVLSGFAARHGARPATAPRSEGTPASAE